MTNSKTKEAYFTTRMFDFFDSDFFLGNRWFERKSNLSICAVNIEQGGSHVETEFVKKRRSDYLEKKQNKCS